MYASVKISLFSCFSWLIGHWPAQAAYREILELSYVRAFSVEWNIADCAEEQVKLP